MKAIFKINGKYSIYIKALKITISVMFLILCQISISIFYGNEMFMKNMEKQNIPLTTFYVKNLKQYNLPYNFIDYLSQSTIKEEFNIEEIKFSEAFFTNNINNDAYIFKSKDASYTEFIGKNIYELSDDEVAVSSYYAYAKFGSLKKAIGKTIKVPITYAITENKKSPILAKKIYKSDEIEFKIATIYSHIGLEKRYLNYLSNPDNLVDSGEVMYKDQIFVSSEAFEKILILYEEDVENSNNLVSSYQIIYNDYNPEVELRLEGYLRLRVNNYDASFIKSEITYDLLRNSENINITMKFINSFQFIALYILMFFSQLYLIYLQILHTKPYFNSKR